MEENIQAALAWLRECYPNFSDQDVNDVEALLRWKENIQALADPNSVRMRAGVLYAVLRSNETLLPELFEDGDVVVDTVMGANGIVCGDALEWLELKWADTGREKFHVSNRYGRNPANPNWLN